MSKVENLHSEWMKKPKYKAAFEEMGTEFKVARNNLKNFMNALIKKNGPPEFKPGKYYNSDSDTLTVYFKEDEYSEDRVDKILTLFISDRNRDLVGYEITNYSEIFKKNE